MENFLPFTEDVMVPYYLDGSSFIVKLYTEAEADGIFNEFFESKV